MVSLDGGADPQASMPSPRDLLPQQRPARPIRPARGPRPERAAPSVAPAVAPAAADGTAVADRTAGARAAGGVTGGQSHRAAGRPVSRAGSARRWPRGSVVTSPWAVLAAAASIFAAVARSFPGAVPWVAIALFVLIGITMTHPVYLALDALGVGTVVVIVLTLAGQHAWSSQTVGLVLLGTIVLGFALHRDRDTVIAAIGGAAAADALLLDLRERIWRPRAPLELSPQWLLETDLRAARGDGFCGDFIVAASDPGRRLDVALVDVSGKGRAAGARAVLLSGALEALLNAVPAEQFLPAANAHVLRTGDDDGFATAIHASIDLVSGEFTIAGAGHPPAVHYRAGAGRWDLLDDDQGPVLGLMPGPAYPAQSGVLARGDVLLLYTDGLVESRVLDVTRGIDRLVGHAEAQLARHGEGLAPAIAGAIRAQDGDDRALVVLRRL